MSQDMVKNQSFQYALEKLKTRLNSHSLHMSINLIGHGIRSGRGLSNSLFQIADILQDRELMKQSVATQFSAVKTTVLVLVMISSPILFSCSIVAGSIMGDFRGELADTLPADIAAQSFINPTKSGVTLDFLNSYIITSLLISSLLGSFIVGQVTTGRITDGLRYVMALTAVSEITYVLVKNTLLNYLGGALL